MSAARMSRGDLRVHLVETYLGRPRARDLDSRIQRHATIAECVGMAFAELWLVLSPRAGVARRPALVAEQLDRALAAVAALDPPGRAFLVLVGTLAPDADAAIAAFHRWSPRGRVVQTPPIVDDAEPGLQTSDEVGVMRFLAALHAVKREIDERAAGFFDHQAIRCPVAPTARLPLAWAPRAAHSAITACDGERTEPLEVRPDAVVPLAELCEVAAIVHGAAVLPVGPEVVLTSIDRWFAERARGFTDHATTAAAAAAGVPTLEGGELEAMVEALKQRQDDCLRRERSRAERILTELDRHTIERSGARLIYLTTGTGKPLFLLNALGQRLRFWTRLIVQLAHRYRVVIWEPRGLDDDAEVSLHDQVGDLEAIARAEGVDRLGLVAWCTGPKVAIEYHLRNPGVVSGIVMLNASFKCAGSPAELDTDYDRTFEPICHALVRRPAMASSLVDSLGRSDNDEDPPLELEGDPLASAVLAAMNRELRSEVRAPFRTAPVLARYARQVHDFWSYDARAAAPRVTAPVLLVASQHDRVASPESSRLVADLFPRSELVLLEGATHYCLYDDPELIGELVEDFMERCT